jgi:DNA-binding LacI/PurR family transcriptional regulator
MAVVATTQGLPGDHDFLDGVSDAMTAAGLPFNAMMLRIVPPDMNACIPLVRDLLQSEDRPSGLIGRSDTCDAIRIAVDELKLEVPHQVEIVFEEDWTGSQEDRKCYPQATASASGEEIGRLWGRMLKQQAEGGQLEPRRIVIPVEFREAEKATEA